MGFLVPAVKAVAAFVAKSAIAKAAVKLAATAVISKVASKSISKLIAKRANTEAPSGGDAGGRVQLPPASDNKLPVVYGTAWVGGPVVDAKISVDQKYMWYVVALCEKTDTGTVSFDLTNGVYYDGKRVDFGSNGAVLSLTTNTTPPQTDTKVQNKIYIWFFSDGSNSGVNTGGQTAIQIMSDSVTGGGIPASERWNGPIYTTGGQSATMNNTVFAIVRVEYNVDSGTTGLGTLQVKVTNNMGGDNGAKPGTAILDYMTNERYGCGISLENIDVASLSALDNYSDEFITYVPQEGGSAQQRRYRINGPLDTSNTCLNNLQFLVDSCDSWLQYTETTGKWRIVINKPYEGTPFLINSSNLIGGIQINPIDLNETYNQVEVAYPNTNVKDQTDYQIVDLTDPTTAWYASYNSVLSPNEAVNRLNVVLPLVNNAVQAKYLAVRRLLQSREDLVISCNLDYSGIQIDAGDVIRVTHEAYGWTDKLFRVSQVNEVQDENGNLGASIEAFEYNSLIYNDNAIQDFVPNDNTGLSDPNVISPPCVPIITPFSDANSLITGFEVCSCVPEQGTVLYMDLNYGFSDNVQTHQLYRTVQSAGGLPFINSPNIANGNVTSICISVNDLPAGNYYWSATARNDQAGRSSGSTGVYLWGGANVRPYDPNSNTGGLVGNQYQPNSVGWTTCNTSLYALNPILQVGFDISGGNSTGVTLPVDITTLNINTVDRPWYFNGPNANVNANYYYPYIQGTSTTANGYFANSIAPFYPGDATLLGLANGDDGWYFAVGGGYVSPVVDSIQYKEYDLVMQLYTNTPATVQLLPVGIVSVGNTIVGLSDSGSISSHYLEVPNMPYVVSVTFRTVPVGYTETAGAIMIKNLTANANVVCGTCNLLMFKGKV